MSSIREIALAKAIGGSGGGDITVESLSVTENGTTVAPAGTAYSPVSVNVQPTLQSKTATENGTVTPDSGYDGLSEVVVDVSGDIDIETLTVTENGTVVAPAGKAYGTVIVDVPARTPRGSGTSAYDIGAFLSDYDWRGAAALQTA